MHRCQIWLAARRPLFAHVTHNDLVWERRQRKTEQRRLFLGTNCYPGKNRANYLKRVKTWLTRIRPFHSQDLTSNSPYRLPFNSYYVRSQNLVLDQRIIPWFIFFFILITCLLDTYWNCEKKFCLDHPLDHGSLNPNICLVESVKSEFSGSITKRGIPRL